MNKYQCHIGRRKQGERHRNYSKKTLDRIHDRFMYLHINHDTPRFSMREYMRLEAVLISCRRQTIVIKD